MKNLIAFLTITLFSSLLMANVDPQVNTKYVYAYSGLSLRAQPNTEGQILKVIPYGDKVIILETEEHEQTIEWMSGKWVKVSHGDTEGYLFEGFISDLPIPAYNFEMTQNDLDLTYPLIAWAEYHFDESRVPDTLVNDKLDMMTQYLEDGIVLTRKDTPYDFSVALELPATSIGDAYNLIKSMLLTKPERLTVENKTVFMDNLDGEIDRIKVNLENPIVIKQLKNGNIRIKVTAYHQGCDIY